MSPYVLNGDQLSISTLIRRVTSRPTKPRKSSLRLDVQGLRAFAVVVVIADHLFKWPSGGFVGVDIFFVISGFVITQSMLREHDRSGRVSVIAFYKRRVKRIMPAAALTLVFTVVAAYFAFTASRFWSVLLDAGFSAIFVANWRFANVGTDYFQASGPVSPLQHFWSLAVEEQFYLFWPFIVAGVFFVALKGRLNGSGARTVLAVTISLITAASLIWAFVETASAPTSAYFSTLSRAWELGIGALLALGAPAFSRLSSAARPVLAWAGVAGMVAALFLVTGTSTFPAPWALLPVLSAALFIAAGCGASTQNYLAPFTNPASVYIGTISYSLYLWHFPIIIIAGAWLDTSNLTVQLALLAAIFVWSYFAYELVEKRILDSSWLTGKKRKTSFREGTTFSTSYQLKALSLLAILALGAVYMGVRPPAPPTYTAIPIVTTVTPSPSATEGLVKPSYGAEVSALQEQIRKSVSAAEWPVLTPTMDEAISTDPYPRGVSGCGTKDWGGFEACTFGDLQGDRSMLLIGDSVAMKWAGSLIPAATERGYRITIAAMFGCPFNDASKRFDTDAKEAECSSRNAQVKDYAAASNADMVLVGNTSLLPNAAKSSSPITVTSWSAGLVAALNTAGATSQTIVLSAPPADIDIRECYKPNSTPAGCMSAKTSAWQTVTSAEGKSVASVGAKYLDTSPLFCVENFCPAFVGTVATKRDQTHTTLAYAELISAPLWEMLSELSPIK